VSVLPVPYSSIKLDDVLTMPPQHGAKQMPKVMIPEDIVEKLERAVFLRWADDQGDAIKADALADERTALIAELTLLFGPVVRLLVESEILSVHVGENDFFPGIMTTVNGVAIDDEFGISLDFEPSESMSRPA
jgi:hypothetical protein